MTDIIDIKKYSLVFTGLKKRLNTRRIIVHHSAGLDAAVTEMHRWHLARGFSGVGYHYVIRADGTVEEGRPLYALGAHAGAEGNPDSIGICLTGNFMQGIPNPEQMESLVSLVNYLRDFYGRKLSVIRHKDVVPTACPGRYFPWEEFCQRLNKKEVNIMTEPWKQEIMTQAGKEGLITGEHRPDDTAPKWFVLAVALYMLKKMEVAASEG